MKEAAPASSTTERLICIQGGGALYYFRFLEFGIPKGALRHEILTMHRAPASACAGTFQNRSLNGSALCSFKAVVHANGAPKGAFADELDVMRWPTSAGDLIGSPSAQSIANAAQNGQDGILGSGISGSEQNGKARHTGLDVTLKILPKGQYTDAPHGYTIAEVVNQLSMDHPRICRSLEMVFLDPALLIRLQELTRPSTHDRSKRSIPMFCETPHASNVIGGCDVDVLKVVGLINQGGLHIFETYHDLTFVMGTGTSCMSVPRQLDTVGGAVSPAAKQTFALSRMNFASHDSASHYSDNFISDTFDIFRNAFLKHYDCVIRNALEEIFGDSVEIWLAPLSMVVKRRFFSVLKERRADRVAPTFHGTPSSNFVSIFERGLLIPGQGNELHVSNGSYHGLGIYTANLDAPWLSKRFCSDSQILVCAVIQSSAVTHVMDAQVVFDAPQVVPLIVGMSKTFRPLDQDMFWPWSFMSRPHNALPLPVPVVISKLLDASLLGDLETVSHANKLRVFYTRVFYTGAPFRLESKTLIDYAMQGWAMSDIIDLSLTSDAYVHVYFDGQRSAIAIAVNQLSTCHPGLPGRFQIGDTVFLLSHWKDSRSAESDYERSYVFPSFSEHKWHLSMPRGRGSRGKVIGSDSYRKLRVQFDGEMSPVQVFVDDICKASPCLARGLQISQLVFFIGRRRRQVDYGERGVLLFECDAQRLMVQFGQTRMDVNLCELSLQKPSGPPWPHKGCRAVLKCTICYEPYDDCERNNLWHIRPWSFVYTPRFSRHSLIPGGTVGDIVGIVSESEVLMRFYQYDEPVSVRISNLADSTFVQVVRWKKKPDQLIPITLINSAIDFVHVTIRDQLDTWRTSRVYGRSLAQIEENQRKLRRESEKSVQRQSNKREKQSQSRGSTFPLAGRKRALRHGFPRYRSVAR